MVSSRINQYGIIKSSRSKKRQTFEIKKSLKVLRDLMPELPDEEDSFRLVSVRGGFSSISFITHVALQEPISELTATTLRVGKKQLNILQQLKRDGRLYDARFLVGGIMKENKAHGKEYDYFTYLNDVCKKQGWQYQAVNNHSKIILMRTADNHYVLETSLNLNENPKIEQFTFENDEGLYDFYYNLYKEMW